MQAVFWMALGDPLKSCFQVFERIDAVELGRFDQGRDATPGLSSFIMTRKQRVLAAQSQFPFILPMSGGFPVCVTDGMPISDQMSGCFNPINAVMDST